MNNYPQQGQYQQTSYQGQPQYNPTQGNETAVDGRPAYFDASASQNPGTTLFGQILIWKMFINLLLIPLQQRNQELSPCKDILSLGGLKDWKQERRADSKYLMDLRLMDTC